MYLPVQSYACDERHEQCAFSSNTVLSQLLMVGLCCQHSCQLAVTRYPALPDCRPSSCAFSCSVIFRASHSSIAASRRGISQLNANLNETSRDWIIQTFGRERTMYDRFSEINNRVFYNTLSNTHLHHTAEETRRKSSITCFSPSHSSISDTATSHKLTLSRSEVYTFSLII